MRILWGDIRRRTGRWGAGIALAVLLAAVGILCFGRWGRDLGRCIPAFVQTCGEWLVGQIWSSSCLGGEKKGVGGDHGFLDDIDREPDPSYRRYQQYRDFYEEHQYLAVYGNEESGSQSLAEAGLMEIPAGEDRGKSLHGSGQWGQGEDTEKSTEEDSDKKRGENTEGREWNEGNTAEKADEKAAGKADELPGTTYMLEQLMDYDFLMKHFYNVHTSTTADRGLMDAKALLSRDLALKDQGEGPQILIYHTHSQEAYCDSGPGENVVAVGSYLASLLEQKGYQVYHDTSVYDLRDGKLDRSKAYNYALEGIQPILKENPSIQVVLDLHRDGVGDEVRLVSEIQGKPAAKIMFFNGLSQTPEGPIEYLKNPYREDNLAFSLALQLKAAAFYPGFTRKIYLKGLRYNQHLCPRSSLIEVGAQTNTYEEARNAMEPLAELLDMVLRPHPRP